MTGIDIRRHQADLVQPLHQMDAIKVSIRASQRPYRVRLQFANPYAYRGAQLLAQYDRLVCTALTAQHIGQLNGETCIQVQKACASKLRALFLIPQRYRFLKLDRESIRKARGKRHEARHVMGEVPDDILSGERQAPLVPRKVTFPSGITGQVNLCARVPVWNANGSENQNDDG